jgi:DNA-directed RNA polymerase specialized sigma24 family protein
MADEGSDDPSGNQDIDWNALRATVRGTVQAQLGHAEREVIEDLTQEAMVGILRVLRREPARDLTALARVVARNTAIDEIRRRQRDRDRVAGLQTKLAADDGMDGASHDSGQDSPEFLWFLLVEYFRAQNSPCHRLALLYAEKGDWPSVAAALDLSHDVVRKQWSRGTQAFRAALSKDPGPFKEWLDDV